MTAPSPGRDRRPFVLGLTGSIGMGKSTTAQMFRDEGVPVFDADAVVHRLYAGAAAPAVEAAFPGTTLGGAVDRDRLRTRVLADPDALARLEAVVHPLVQAERTAFLGRARADGAALVVLDIPLLYETGSETAVEAVAVVSAPESVQKTRVLARDGMTADRLAAILARQMPDAEKRRRARFVIETGCGFDHARDQVRAIVASVLGGGSGADEKEV